MINPFRYFNSSPKIIRLTVMMYVHYPLSPRQVEDLLFERGIDICHETVRLWWNRFGPVFAAEIRKLSWPPQPFSNNFSQRQFCRILNQSCRRFEPAADRATVTLST